MGLRDFLFEKVEEDVMPYNESYDTYTEDIDVNTENITQENLIGDIYNHNDLSDVSKSIFKIEELINSLPKEMPNETKKTTVLSMLAIFGLTIDELVNDGKNRISVVTGARDEIIEDNNNAIVNNSAIIENKKLEIQELEKDNTLREVVIKDTDDKIECEIKRISKLINFIGGESL